METKPIKRVIRIAIAEDNMGDVGLVREALDTEKLNYELEIKRDGEQMLAFVEALDAPEAHCPDLILLDLNLPRTDGETILERIRQTLRCKTIPVIIITSSDSPRDREAARNKGANAFFRKPSDYDEFLSLGKVVREVLVQHSAPLPQ